MSLTRKAFGGSYGLGWGIGSVAGGIAGDMRMVDWDQSKQMSFKSNAW